MRMADNSFGPSFESTTHATRGPVRAISLSGHLAWASAGTFGSLAHVAPPAERFSSVTAICGATFDVLERPSSVEAYVACPLCLELVRKLFSG